MLRRLAHAAASTALESSLLPCASGSLISFGAWGRDFTSTASSSDEQSNDRTVNFGFRKVLEEEKERLVAGVFSSVAPKYDVMNDLMSAGLHRLWKDRLVEKLRPFPGMQHLDVAGGTGDISFRIYNALQRSGSPSTSSTIVVSDINPDMLTEGKKRAATLGYRHFDWDQIQLEQQDQGQSHDAGPGPRLLFKEGNAEELPFADNSFDSYTVSFGIRNVTHIDRALSEAYRVLRKGGRLMVLEFSSVHPALKPVYDLYSFNVIPQIGRVVAGDADSYAYLVESIRKFPDQITFEGMIRDAGFKAVGHENLSAGICAIHSGFKL